jgi:glycosyltransferase involved in cell wall biosynthesis
MKSQLGPRVTIIIPYYKNLGYLDLAIQSVRAQTCNQWEAIVLDDCGGEDAHGLVVGYQDSRFRYVRNEQNLGLAGNWNKGLILAETELVSIFHADDMLLPNYVDEVIRLMDRHPDATACHCRSEIIDKDGERCWSFVDEVKKVIRPKSKTEIVTIGDAGLASLLGGSWIICPTLTFRKSQINDLLFNPRWKFMVDVDFISAILFGGGTIIGTYKIAYKYRRHSMNQTTELTKSSIRFVEQFSFLNEINEKSRSIGWNKCTKKSRRKTGLRFHLLVQSVVYVRSKRFQLANKAIRSALQGIDRF